MAKDHPSHSELSSDGPIVDIELASNKPPIFIDHAFYHLEIELSDDPETPPFEIVSGFDWPQVEARYIVVQPSALAEDARRGWMPVGGIYSEYVAIEPSEQPQFNFSKIAAGRSALFLVGAYETYLSLTGCGDTLATAHVPIGSVITAAEASRRREEERINSES